MIVLINETLMVYKSLFPPTKSVFMSRNMVKKRVWIFGASRIGRGKKLGCFGVEWRKAAPSEGFVGTFLPVRCRLPTR